MARHNFRRVLCDQTADDQRRRLHQPAPPFGGGTAFGTGAEHAERQPRLLLRSGGPRTVNVCFETTLDENTPVATYTDTVAVSVTF